MGGGGGSGFRVQGAGFRVQVSGFRVQGSGFRVQGACVVPEGVEAVLVQNTGNLVYDSGYGV